MQSISKMMGYPDGTPIDKTSFKIESARPRRETNGQYGPSSVQNGVAVDSDGSRIPIVVWKHPDITPMIGKHVLVSSSKPGDLAVKLGKEYQGNRPLELHINQKATFQLVALGQGQAAAAADKTNTGAMSDQPVARAVASNPFIHGATAGEATKLVCEALISTGNFETLAVEGKLTDVIIKWGSQIVKGHLALEAGQGINLATEPVKSTARATPAPSVAPAVDPNSGEVDDNQIPF